MCSLLTRKALGKKKKKEKVLPPFCPWKHISVLLNSNASNMALWENGFSQLHVALNNEGENLSGSVSIRSSGTAFIMKLINTSSINSK